MNYLAEFFKLDFIISNQINVYNFNKEKQEIIGSYKSTLKKYYNKDLSSSEENIYKDKGSNNFIEIIDSNSTYVFGIIGKSNNVSKGVMKRVKDATGESLENTDLLLENYRYFFFDLDSSYCAVIKNSEAPAFKLLFTKYISSILLNKELSMPANLSFNNVYDDKIQSKINRFTNLLELNLVFDDNSSLGTQLLKMEDTFNLSNSNLRKVSISIDFKKQIISDDFKELVKNDELIKSNFGKFELTGDNQENTEETIELVQKLLTKNLKLEINEKELIGEDSLEEIKKALQESLKSLWFHC